MMGGSGTDVFRLVSLEGADGGAVALDALGVRMHIADLSASDGIDLSALLAANAGQAGYRSFTLANRVASERGDARISLSDAVIQGLQGPVQESGVRAAAPLTPVATSSLLSVSMVVDEASLTGAIQRGSALKAQSTAPYGNSPQDVVDAVSPLYFGHERLISQLVLDLSTPPVA